MRLRLLIEDVEYREAFKDVIDAVYRDIYVEILDELSVESITSSTMIVTDISYEHLALKINDVLINRIIFLTNDPMDVPNCSSIENEKVHKLFMYRNINTILSEVSQIYYLISGDVSSGVGIGKKYLICGDSSEYTCQVSKLLARQIRFTHGGNILIVSLTYINAFPLDEETNCTSFARMMYYRESRKPFNLNWFTYDDSYGISYLRLPIGHNPMAYLEKSSLVSLINEFILNSFDTIIMDIGSEFSEVNLSLFDYSSHIVVCDTGKRSTNWNSFSQIKRMINDVRVMNTALKNIELEIDDYIKEIYGETGINGDKTQESSKKISKRDRKSLI